MLALHPQLHMCGFCNITFWRVQMLDVAVAASHPRAFFLLGSMYEYGGADFGADYAVAKRLYETGCREHVSA